MPSKCWIIAGAALVLLGVLLIAIRNSWISTIGFFLGIAGIVVLVMAIPKAGGSGQGQT